MRNKITAARRLWLPLILCAALLGVLTLNAAAATAAQLRPDMTIIIDGAEQTFYNAQGQEVHPILCGGTTYLPVRAIGEVMGKNVDWNQTKKTVTLSGTRTTPATAGTPDAAAKVKNISVDIRTDFIIVVDGTTQVFKDAAGKRVYPMLYNGSTYLPLRAVGGLMGKTVAWDGATQTVTLTTPNGQLLRRDQQARRNRPHYAGGGKGRGPEAREADGGSSHIRQTEAGAGGRTAGI